MSNEKWFKGNKPTKLEQYVHDEMFRQSEQVIDHWKSLGLLTEDARTPDMAEEMRDAWETGRSIRV